MCFQTACFKYQKMEQKIHPQPLKFKSSNPPPPLKKNPCPPMDWMQNLLNRIIYFWYLIWFDLLQQLMNEVEVLPDFLIWCKIYETIIWFDLLQQLFDDAELLPDLAIGCKTCEIVIW